MCIRDRLDAGPGVRRALRSFSPDENDWTSLSLSVIAALGLPAGLMSWPDRVFALVDTGIPMSGVVATIPGLARYSTVLSALSREGLLCLPLSGRPAPAASKAAAWSLVDALETCRDRGVGTATISWLGTSATAATAGPAAPVPFPFVPPCLPVRPSGEALRDAITEALEQMK